MSEIQVCEGVWENRIGQRLYITEREPVRGQRWTDGLRIYSDDGSWPLDGHQTSECLVEYIGPLPDSSQRAPVSRPAETESTTAVAGGVSDDPGRIIYELEERLKAANSEINRLRIELQETYAGWSGSNSALAEQTVEINKLKAEWQTEFTAAQQLRSEIAQLERLLDDARENLRDQEAAARAFDHHCEGMKAAFLAVIKTFVEMRS